MGIVACAYVPMVGQFMYRYLVKPLIQSMLSLVVTIVMERATRRCLWGEPDQFPRRIGLLIFLDFLSTFCGFAASVVTAFTRIAKSLVVSVLGLLSVTSPGAHEASVLTDSIHSYYLYVLWQERFKLEVDRGGIQVQEPVSGWGPMCKDILSVAGQCCALSTVVVGIQMFMFWLEGPASPQQ